jgi:hypothetical protein
VDKTEAALDRVRSVKSSGNAGVGFHPEAASLAEHLRTVSAGQRRFQPGLLGRDLGGLASCAIHS